MYNIEIYEDTNGKSEVKEYIQKLQQNNSKDSKIKFNKTIAYIRMLKQEGLKLKEPYINMKQTQKTPIREIEKAKRLLEDYKMRSD